MDRTADDPTERRLTALEHACRGTIGDRLRSVTVDSPEWSGTVYRRDDLEPGVDETARAAVTAGEACADGGRTVLAFEDGYIARFQHGDTEVIATSDGLKMDRKKELSAVVRGVLSH
jgi:uncharacterized protein with von Willebrand factor type A (vWA) domain